MDSQRIARKLAEYSIHLDVGQIEMLCRQAEFMERKNREFNLTAITEEAQVEDRHFVDSLVLAAQDEIMGRVVDIGSGPGFPGVPIKILKPGVALTLLESVGKKAKYLEELTKILDLSCTVVNDRAEEYGRSGARGSFDAATARAVAELPVLCELALPLLKEGGWFVAMKGPESGEAEAAQNAIDVLGGQLRQVAPYTLPDGSKRTLVKIQKCRPTPAQYPRAYASIKKRPL